VPKKEGNKVEVSEMISEMLRIDSEIKAHRTSIEELLQKGQSLRSEVEATFTSLPFGLPAIATAKPPKSDSPDDLKTAWKLVLKRAAVKAHAEGKAKDLALTTAMASGQRFLTKRGGVELPWMSEWVGGMIDKLFGQQAVTPVAETTDETTVVEPPIAEAPKAAKKRKK
jgi:hypothetical protein